VDESVYGSASIVLSCAGGGQSLLTDLVCTATGPLGVVIVGVYSFLIAFVLPLPSEVVLLAPLDVGLPTWATLAVVILVSGAGKAAGSLFAFHIGKELRESGYVLGKLRASRFDIVEWSERKSVELAREYGYLGMAVALCVPFFPDTLSVYAFTVLEESYVRFGLASFVGGVGRLVVTVAVVGGGLAVL
jgi:membrane protein YqaA with SNARE-associated domain